MAKIENPSEYIAGWRTKANCSPSDADELFFTERPTPDQKTRRKSLCQSCPIRLECLEDDLRTRPENIRDLVGYRGGLGAEQRKSIVTMKRTIENLKKERTVFNVSTLDLQTPTI
jgi:hypothetical protein